MSTRFAGPIVKLKHHTVWPKREKTLPFVNLLYSGEASATDFDTDASKKKRLNMLQSVHTDLPTLSLPKKRE